MKQASIKKNFVMNVILTLSSVIFPLITFPYISRILLPSGTGKVTFATSLISYFNIFAQLGIPTYGIRATAQVRDDKRELSRVTQELIIINLVTSFLSYIALAISLFTVPKLYDERTLYIIISFTIILNTLGIEWLYKGLEQYTYITFRSMFFKIIALAAMFLLVHQQSDYVIYGGISIFAASASNILNFVNAHKYITLFPVGNYNFKRHLKPVFVFFAMSCATTVYTNLDNVMLGLMTTDTDVGYYGAAVRIKTVLVSIVTSLSAVLLPRASYYFEHGNEKEFRNISVKALQTVLILSVPLTVYFILYARESILFLSGDDFFGAILPMQILMPTLIFIGITNILGIQILVPIGKEKMVLYSEIAGAIIDFLINLILIPSWKSSGAAVGTLVAEAVVLVVQAYYLRDILRVIHKQIKIRNIILSVIISGVLSLIAGNITESIFLRLLITALVYFGSCLGILYLMKEQLVCQVTGQLFAYIKSKF